MRKVLFVLASCAAIGLSMASAQAGVWGAISADNNGAFGVVWQQSDRESALSKAKGECLKRNGKTCSVNRAFEDGWGVVLLCAKNGSQGAVVSDGTKAKEAISKAYKAAYAPPEPRYGKRDCQFKGAVASNGSHTKYRQ